MVFSSHVFVFYFLPAALLFYYAAPRRGRHLVLTVLSYVFYGWSNPFFVFLMLGSTVVDFCCGLAIREDRPGRSKAAVTVSVLVNLSLLGFFKYANFGVESWNAAVIALGFETASWDTLLRVTLPLGISFYTFQSMSYTIDVYRGHAAPIRSFIDFACYVSMFPQLVAGPIVRFHEIADQLAHRRHTLEKMARGVTFFCLGFAKKILLANPCGKVADLCFGAGSLTALDAWYGVVAYAFQIYFDFSGYSDMAVGLGLMLGFTFPRNFDRPYLSRSITEVWRRWHQSLSRWLRDYLYLPLGGNRRGTRRTYANLAAVMLLGGLWHGASWNFLIWGGFHGSFLMLERRLGQKRLFASAPAAVQIAVTFALMLVSWVFFRAADLPAAWRYLEHMAAAADVHSPSGDQGREILLRGVIYQPYYLASFAAAGWIVWRCRDTWEFVERLSWTKGITAVGLFLLSLAFMTSQSYNPFIYFIF